MSLAAALIVALLPNLGSGASATSAPEQDPGAVVQLVPCLALSGAQMASGLDLAGTPSLGAPIAGYQRFIRPLAVAGRGPITYIADVGTGAVYRYDSRYQLMVALPGIRAQAGVQLELGGDLSLYVLDRPGRRVVHYDVSGRVLASFSDAANLGNPVDVVFDETRGRVLVADALYNQLVAFHPLGRASYVIPLRGAGEQVLSIAALAIGPAGIFVSDPACGCIAQVSLDGVVLGTFGHLELDQPGALALDRDGRLFVVDSFDGSLEVFQHAELIAAFAAEKLGLFRIDDVWVEQGWIIVADASGGRVNIMRLLPPAPER